MTKEIATKTTDVPQLRQVSRLLLADPAFDEMNKIGILLGADGLEKKFIGNRMNDKGVVIRGSHFGLIVFGPVQKP